jgi:hypothetical protein
MAGIPVSGPGPFSQRTDRQPIQAIPNAGYGEQKAYKQLQQDAPMAQSSGVPQGADFSAMFGNPANQVVPMGADSTQPGTPVTDGAALGMGRDMSSLGLGNPRSQQDLQNLASQLPVLEYMANQPNASWGLRQLVRNIKGSL